MQRKYIVWIEGKPLVLIEGARPDALAGTFPVVAVERPEQIADAVQALTTGRDVLGFQLIARKGFALWDAFRSSYKFVLAAGGVVHDGQGRLLVIRRLGMWDLPKGKVEEGEGTEAAAVREVQEECGLRELRIERTMHSTWHTYERKGKQHLKRTDWFLMRGSSNETLAPQHEEDIEEVRWVSRAELPLIEGGTYPSLVPVFQAWKALGV